jgi:hypothetical protein
MERLNQKYDSLCRNENEQSSDIYEHLPTLSEYASKCESIIELGVRGVVSTYAFLNGLMSNSSNNKQLLMNDISPCDINEVLEITTALPIDVRYCWMNDLEMTVNHNYDMTFIDTLHVYGQLKRELEHYCNVTNKYIIMHDTTIDGENGELYRKGLSYEQLYQYANNLGAEIGIPANELLLGLIPAVREFLQNHPEWIMEKQYTNNNGLTILKRI